MKANTISSRRDGVELAEQRLLVGDLDRQVRGDRVGQRRRVLDLAQLDARFRRKALVELGVILELVDHRAHQRLGFGPFGGLFLDLLDLGGHDSRRAARD